MNFILSEKQHSFITEHSEHNLQYSIQPDIAIVYCPLCNIGVANSYTLLFDKPILETIKEDL